MSDSTVVSSLSAINRNFLRYTSSVPSSSLAFFFPPPFFLFFFFFFEADKTNIFQAKSVAVGENLQPSFSKTNHARVVVCQPFHLGHCPINNDAIRFDYFPPSPSIRFQQQTMTTISLTTFDFCFNTITFFFFFKY